MEVVSLKRARVEDGDSRDLFDTQSSSETGFRLPAAQGSPFVMPSQSQLPAPTQAPSPTDDSVVPASGQTPTNSPPQRSRTQEIQCDAASIFPAASISPACAVCKRLFNLRERLYELPYACDHFARVCRTCCVAQVSLPCPLCGMAPKSIFDTVRENNMKWFCRLLQVADAIQTSRDADGCDVVHLAVIQKRDRMLNVMIKMGYPVETTDTFGRTPVHYAAKLNRLDCIQRLHLAGASLRGEDLQGLTPIDLAAFYDNRAVLRYLLDQRAHYCGESKRSVSMIAMKADNVECLRMIYDYGICLDEGMHGYTAIHFAASSKASKCIDFLLTLGYAMTDTTASGRTAAEIAADTTQAVM